MPTVPLLYSMRPLWYSSHWAAIQGIMIASVPVTPSGPAPTSSVPPIWATIRNTASASQPARRSSQRDHQEGQGQSQGQGQVRFKFRVRIRVRERVVECEALALVGTGWGRLSLLTMVN